MVMIAPGWLCNNHTFKHKKSFQGGKIYAIISIIIIIIINIAFFYFCRTLNTNSSTILTAMTAILETSWRFSHISLVTQKIKVSHCYIIHQFSTGTLTILIFFSSYQGRQNLLSSMSKCLNAII